jgi:hypothetical protein
MAEPTPSSSADAVPIEFYKIVRDLICDILITFPEMKDELDEDIRCVVTSQDTDTLGPETSASLTILFEHCKQVFPERFFDILYQNQEIFSGDTNTEFLPGLDFGELWNKNITDKTKDTLWKYLQLILFAVIKSVDRKSSFGDTAKLFEAIDEGEFREKLAETMKSMQGLFGDKDEDGEGESKDTNFNLGDLPNPEEIHEHVTGMLDGKLGNLAKEIAAETAEGLNVDLEESASVGDVFQKLFKNPGKLMGLVQSVGKKLDTKLKSGEIKESELIEEAGQLMNKMKNMPGMGNIEQMMKNMHGGGGGKVNMGAFNARMAQNLRQAKTKERMQEKLRKRQEETAPPLFNPENLKHSSFKDGESAEKTPLPGAQAGPKKKKKKNKAKNKNK